MAKRTRLGVKVFADGANLDKMLELAENPLISGFTTNPTLMRNSGVDDYEGFARKVLDHITDRPVSFEVFSDDFDEMRRQAHRMASWGDNVCVKIPVSDTHGTSSAPLVADLTADGLHLNVTALLSLDQVRTMAASLADSSGAVVSVFAGRIADTGRDPVPLMAEAVQLLAEYPTLELLWASPRDPQRAPGRIGRLPHHHRNAGPVGETFRSRPKPRRRVTRYGPYVSPRRCCLGLPVVIWIRHHS